MQPQPVQQQPQQQPQFVTMPPGGVPPQMFAVQQTAGGAQPQMMVMPQQQQQQQQTVVAAGGQQQPQQAQQQQPPQQAPGTPVQASGGAMPGEDPRNLIVNYIPTPVTDNELRQLFEQYGELESARVICDRVTAHPKGYGFVKYKDEAGAKAAMENMNGFEIHNKRLKVTMAKGPHNATINHHTQRLQTVVASTPATMVAPQPGAAVQQLPTGAQLQVAQPGAQVQYVIVDSNMQPIGRGGAVGMPQGAQPVPLQQPPQAPAQPLQMFQIPNAVALGPSNDPMGRESCNNFANLSQYNSFTASQGLSTGQLSVGQMSATGMVQPAGAGHASTGQLPPVSVPPPQGVPK